MLHFLEEGLQVRTISSLGDRNATHRLRHQIFAEELRWVAPTRSGLEVDRYDPHSISIGVFAHGALVASLRIHLATQPFMIEHDLPMVLGDHQLQKTSENIEVTRFCIAPAIRNKMVETGYGEFPLVALLLKALYSWCKQHGKDGIYMVVEKRFHRLLRLLGLPCAQLAPAVRMADGVLAVGALLKWSHFDTINMEHKRQLMAWFNDWQYLEGMAA